MLGVVRVSVLFEAAVAVMLMWRFAAGYGEPWGRAAYLGLFHAVSAFNNAGFGLYADSMMRFVDDPLVCGPIVLAVVAGGLGFPVLFELRRTFGPREAGPCIPRSLLVPLWSYSRAGGC